MSRAEKIKKQADAVRLHVCHMCFEADSGHPASALSAVDIIAALFFSEMRAGASYPSPDDDIFILSKGHAAPALYGTFIEKGILSPGDVTKLRALDSPLQGHPDVQRLPAVGASTGALGQGLSMALGRALALKIRKQDRYVYCVIGDGESQEGQVWEAALFGGNRGLDNLIAFTDYNKSQSDGRLEQVMPLGDLKEKWKAFGWNVSEIRGHDIPEIQEAVRAARSLRGGRPTMILAHTIKGYIDPGYSVASGDHQGRISKESLAEIFQRLR